MRFVTSLAVTSLVAATAVFACGDSDRPRRKPGGMAGTSAGVAGDAGSGGASAGASSAGSSGTSGAGTAGAGNGGSGAGGSAGTAGTGEGGDAGSGEGGEGGGPIARANKLDVLFVVDNSISMSEKQTVLSEAVPTLVSRLIDPHCIFGDTRTVPATNGVCPEGSRREMAPVRDMHVGVITTSLGDRGGDVCKPETDDATAGRTPNDRARLVGSVRTGLRSWNETGFLKWDPDAQATPPGESAVETLTSDLQAMIAAAGDKGCGYEAQLESMYRFLVHPAPPENIAVDGAVSVHMGVDEVLLEQRQAFLRPDSALVIVLLSDEDDCSILDEPGSQGWITGRLGATLPRASASCADPDDRCCRPCTLPPGSGCPSDAEDAACQLGPYLTVADDTTNLRCYRQRERFGVDLLHPVERYVRALSAPTIPGPEGEIENPLFSGGRIPEWVVFMPIVGVPWQDLVKITEDFDGYDLMTARELREAGRFEVILGDYSAGIPPTDPFMIDSIDPRSGTNPITRDPILPPGSATATGTINGHEVTPAYRDDLQYACIFPLPEPVVCTTENQNGCDCNDNEQDYARPLCQHPTTGAHGTTQYFAKAYPGRRELEVARRLGDQAAFASICPRTLEDRASPSYGYIPAMRALQREVNRILEP